MKTTNAYLPGDEPVTQKPAESPASDPHWAYDTREPLQCAATTLHRQIGVLASTPFHHHGLNATYVDVRRESVTVNTAEYGNAYPVEESEQRIREMTEETIADLDKVIAELNEHRDRLAGSERVR